jgi:hypothetical protein
MFLFYFLGTTVHTGAVNDFFAAFIKLAANGRTNYKLQITVSLRVKKISLKMSGGSTLKEKVNKSNKFFWAAKKNFDEKKFLFVLNRCNTGMFLVGMYR